MGAGGIDADATISFRRDLIKAVLTTRKTPSSAVHPPEARGETRAIVLH
jgi:hypothetical protein